MIVNQQALIEANPIANMMVHKVTDVPYSYGLTEAGYDIRIKQAITLDWNHKFSLASSIEYFQLPNDLVGVLHDKSSWARQGLSVFNTVLEPGWRGWLTLELAYHGSERLIIPAGAGIGQVIFSKLSVPATYSGKYNNQGDYPNEAVK